MPTKLADRNRRETASTATPHSRVSLSLKWTVEHLSTKRFRSAFSFAREKRNFVAKVAALLATRLGEDKPLRQISPVGVLK